MREMEFAGLQPQKLAPAGRPITVGLYDREWKWSSSYPQLSRCQRMAAPVRPDPQVQVLPSAAADRPFPIGAFARSPNCPQNTADKASGTAPEDVFERKATDATTHRSTPSARHFSNRARSISCWEGVTGPFCFNTKLYSPRYSQASSVDHSNQPAHIMASLTDNNNNKPGLTVETTSMSRLSTKTSQETLTPEPFPTLTEKDTSASRLSDLSTPATTHRLNPFDTDIEAMITNENSHKRSAECTKGGTDCQVWPGQDHWKRKAKAAKKNRRACNCLAGLSKRNRILVKILLIFLIVGIAVGVGFGVSKPLGAGIWRSETQNS
ncbi:hypothetical protein QC761_206280 [Podospora bellae-mahoneyi]|nr:hypothetical protein QC761_206280 [Podospora bellae-mahoneyi]